MTMEKRRGHCSCTKASTVNFSSGGEGRGHCINEGEEEKSLNRRVAEVTAAVEAEAESTGDEGEE